MHTVLDVLTAVPRRVHAVHFTDEIHKIPRKYFGDCHQLKHIIFLMASKLLVTVKIDLVIP